jgi:hypothetical protein
LQHAFLRVHLHDRFVVAVSVHHDADPRELRQRMTVHVALSLNVLEAGVHVRDVLEFRPIGLEGIDERRTSFTRNRGVHVENVHLLPPGKGWLLVEFGGESKANCAEQARTAMHGPPAEVCHNLREVFRKKRVTVGGGREYHQMFLE